MAGTNNFLQWNPAENNMLTDVQYLGDSMRLNGATAQIYPSNVHNKFAYQTTTFITAMAQMLANRGYTVSDSSLPALISVFDELVDKSGATMTGNLILNGDPTLALQATTKQYVDTFSRGVKRSTAYLIGDIAYSVNLPTWARLQCVVAGTTNSTEPSWGTTAGVLIADGTATWIIDDIRDGLVVGSFDFSHILKVGRIKANGSLISRDLYPRLWKYVNDNSLAITESSWSNGMSGMFSVGDGSTTFRVPDLRGEFLRGYDDDRNLDTTSFKGTTANGSATITTINIPGGLTTNILYVGQSISGTGIPSGATIASIVSDTSITISANATASATVVITVTNRRIGSMQSDAIRNITGLVGGRGASDVTSSGAFAQLADSSTYYNATAVGAGYGAFLDVSTTVSTAPENRPQNIALIAQIKY